MRKRVSHGRREKEKTKEEKITQKKMTRRHRACGDYAGKRRKRRINTEFTEPGAQRHREDIALRTEGIKKI
jgi:hypothetical protein